jgi:hypothetical protein
MTSKAIQDLNESKSSLNTKYYPIVKAIEHLNRWEDKTNSLTNIKKYLTGILDKNYYPSLNLINDSLKFIKTNCKHDYELEGHNSHQDYYVCKICGESEWV